MGKPGRGLATTVSHPYEVTPSILTCLQMPSVAVWQQILPWDNTLSHFKVPPFSPLLCSWLQRPALAGGFAAAEAKLNFATPRLKAK